MMDWYLYSKNDKMNYFDGQDLKIRNIVASPLLFQKVRWYLMLFVYCIYIRLNNNEGSIYRIGMIILSVSVIGTFISLVIKSIRAYVLWQNIDIDELVFTYNKYLVKKWITFFIESLFSISLVLYCTGNQFWTTILFMMISIKIIIKLLSIGLDTFRKVMTQETIDIEANEEYDESEEDRYKLAREGLEESIIDKYAIEILWGTGYKHILLELKNLLDKVEEVTKEEKETFQNKTYLITNLSHDLKTPLTCIINSVYILKNEKLTQSEKEEEITKLTNQLERLKSLINNLNEIIDAEYTGISLNKENIDICDLLKDFIAVFEEKLNKQDLELRVNMPKEPVTLYLDKDKIIRVFENIFSNIEKHSLEESRVYIDMNIDTDQGNIEIEFKNISKYEIDVDKNTIGNRFVQGDGSRNTDGHGLGISIIKSLIRTQGGNVDIKLDGDLFKITLKFNAI